MYRHFTLTKWVLNSAIQSLKGPYDWSDHTGTVAYWPLLFDKNAIRALYSVFKSLYYDHGSL